MLPSFLAPLSSLFGSSEALSTAQQCRHHYDNKNIDKKKQLRDSTIIKQTVIMRNDIQLTKKLNAR